MPKDLVEIKTYLDDKVGQEIVVTVQMGRKKRKERRGILEETYRSVFVVALDQDENSFDRASYSYRDILTNAIELQFI
ncbi:Veg family protein [Fundicoccus culcitae]|uniref:Veg family protein n=1 Tax=Fundicoccus culcitae TaxID=2969821 RepID=A0ABY5P2Q5_9LACT|nr:Veg family protein [Fundicoccus culcitae]UUX32890.1 Veg family protein [Fundicoccus culcitae]